MMIRLKPVVLHTCKRDKVSGRPCLQYVQRWSIYTITHCVSKVQVSVFTVKGGGEGMGVSFPVPFVQDPVVRPLILGSLFYLSLFKVSLDGH